MNFLTGLWRNNFRLQQTAARNYSDDKFHQAFQPAPVETVDVEEATNMVSSATEPFQFPEDPLKDVIKAPTCTAEEQHQWNDEVRMKAQTMQAEKLAIPASQSMPNTEPILCPEQAIQGIYAADAMGRLNASAPFPTVLQRWQPTPAAELPPMPSRFPAIPPATSPSRPRVQEQPACRQWRPQEPEIQFLLTPMQHTWPGAEDESFQDMADMMQERDENRQPKQWIQVNDLSEIFFTGRRRTGVIEPPPPRVGHDLGHLIARHQGVRGSLQKIFNGFLGSWAISSVGNKSTVEEPGRIIILFKVLVKSVGSHGWIHWSKRRIMFRSTWCPAS